MYVAWKWEVIKWQEHGKNTTSAFLLQCCFLPTGPREKPCKGTTQRLGISSAVFQRQISQIHSQNSCLKIRKWSAPNLSPICHHLLKLSTSDGAELWAGREMSWLKLLSHGLYMNFWCFQSSFCFPCQKPRNHKEFHFDKWYWTCTKKFCFKFSRCLNKLLQYCALWTKEVPYKLRLRKIFYSSLWELYFLTSFADCNLSLMHFVMIQLSLIWQCLLGIFVCILRLVFTLKIDPLFFVWFSKKN